MSSLWLQAFRPETDGPGVGQGVPAGAGPGDWALSKARREGLGLPGDAGELACARAEADEWGGGPRLWSGGGGGGGGGEVAVEVVETVDLLVGAGAEVAAAEVAGVVWVRGSRRPSTVILLHPPLTCSRRFNRDGERAPAK